MNWVRPSWISFCAACIFLGCGPLLADAQDSTPRFSGPATPAAATSPATMPSLKLPSPPKQPAVGFGGSDYAHHALTDWSLGEGGTQVWVFEPASPVPDSAPVVVMMHGWLESNPRAYSAWIKHMVLRGNIVVYPRYQAYPLSPMANYIQDAATGLKSALAELNKAGHVRPLLDQCAFVGHSCGASIIVALAASAVDRGIPAPRAIVVVEPGASRELKMGDIAKVPAQTVVAMIVGDRDRIVGATEATELMSRMTEVPTRRKVFITLRTDGHGSPAIIGSHEAPLSLASEIDGLDIPDRITGKSANQLGSSDTQPRANCFMATPPDAMDFYGLWKTTDAVFGAALHGGDLPDSMIYSKEFRSMGNWSDGVPVKMLEVRREP